MAAATIREVETGLIKRHGNDAREFLRAAADPSVDRSTLYALKNTSLELSIEVSRLWSGELIDAQREWIAALTAQLRPTKILDLGCEQGLVTESLAEAAATADLRAVDRCPQAIAAARTFSQSWSSAPPVFHVGDLRDPWHAEWAAGEMDLVHASRSMLGEVIEPSAELPLEIVPGESDATGEWLREARSLAGRVAAATKVGGTFVSLDRTDLTGAIRWARVLAENGFELDAERSRLFDAPGPDSADVQLPCLVFTMRADSQASPSAARVSAALSSPARVAGQFEGWTAESTVLAAIAGGAGTTFTSGSGDQMGGVWQRQDGLVVEGRLAVEHRTIAWVHEAGSQDAVTARLRAEMESLG